MAFSFRANEIVWAKVKGYAFWPAKVRILRKANFFKKILFFFKLNFSLRIPKWSSAFAFSIPFFDFRKKLTLLLDWTY